MSLLASLQTWLCKKAAKTLAREKPLVIGVTGSVGKSTTKQAIGAMLQADLPENAIRIPEASYNNELGLPLTVFGHDAPGRSPWAWLSLVADAWLTAAGLRKTGMRVFVFEMGADKPGDIDYLATIAPPDIAVLTAVTAEDPTLIPVHAANYPSVDALVEQKAALIKRLKPGGIAILNADDKRVFTMRHQTPEHVLTFGEADGTDVRIVSKAIMTEPGPYGNVPTGLRVSLEMYEDHFDAVIPGVYGTSVAYAFAASAALGAGLDLPIEQMKEFDEHFHPAPGRARIIPGIKHTTLFDDTYNASPASVIQSLKDLGTIPTAAGQRKIACLGEMRELGEKAEAMHRRIGAETAKAGIDVLVCCGIFGAAMAEGANANGMKPEQVHVIGDTPEAGLFIQEMLKPGDIVLAKSSQGTLAAKGVRMERVIKELMAEPARASELLVRQSAVWLRK